MNYRMTVMLLAAMSLLTMPLIARHDGHERPARVPRGIKGSQRIAAHPFRGTRDPRIDGQ